MESSKKIYNIIIPLGIKKIIQIKTKSSDKKIRFPDFSLNKIIPKINKPIKTNKIKLIESATRKIPNQEKLLINKNVTKTKKPKNHKGLKNQTILSKRNSIKAIKTL